jgi:hypothetical protein
MRPFCAACLHCGLPDFTATAEEAPPPIVTLESVVARTSKHRGLFKSPRARVALVLTYYAPPSPVGAESVLQLARPLIKTTGDSIVVLQELNNAWRSRNLGIRVSWQRVYVLASDGSWTSP